MEIQATAAKPNYLNHEKGFWSWIMSVDHKRIGLLYMFSMLFFFIIGGLAALVVRAELMQAGETIIKDETYNTMFTLHGIIMVFLFIVPGVPAILGNFLLPLMIGAKDVAFPRLNRLSYWIYIGGAFAAGLCVFGGLDTGWTFYAPYSVQNRLPVIAATSAAFILGFSSILTGVNFLVTIHKMRCPGMTWDRLPLFVWALYSTALLQVIATPIVGVTLLMLTLENIFPSIGIFNAAQGGDPLLFEHMFWFYSHPVVYIMILPAFGIISEIVPVFSRKPLFGYKALVYASVGIAAISFLVWGHHMFVAGMSNIARYLFSFLTFFVAVPTAVKVFNWVATMYKGSISWKTPMLYAMGFVFTFMIAGTTGIHLATLATDAHYHDTYFVVAHFHYTMQGGTVFAMFGGLHFWFPKMFGRMYHEGFAKISWLLLFIGFNGTFLPQFVLGMQGMPRRYYDYPAEFEPLHMVSSIFAFINGISYLLIIIHLAWAAKWGKKAERNPHDSLSLEWQTDSPPIHDNFETIPRVESWTYGYGDKRQTLHTEASH